MPLASLEEESQEQKKFGIQVPDNPRHAYLLDKLNGNNQWTDAIAKKPAEIDEFKVLRVGPREHHHLLGTRGSRFLLCLM